MFHGDEGRLGALAGRSSRYHRHGGQGGSLDTGADLDAGAVAGTLSALIGRDGRLAVGDGAGFPVEAWPGVLELLRRRRDVRLLLGLCLSAPDRADELPADRASTVVGGFGARRWAAAGQIPLPPRRP